MKLVSRFISAFILTAAIYYSIITHINYGFSSYSMIRFSGIGLSGFLFFLAIRNIPWIIRMSEKMSLNRIERHGALVLAFLLSVTQFALIDEISRLYHDRLLNESSELTTARVLDCEKNYCDCSYTVNGALLKQKIRFPNEALTTGDSVQIYYHQNNPNIFRVIR